MRSPEQALDACQALAQAPLQIFVAGAFDARALRLGTRRFGWERCALRGFLAR
jgi:hypothetical protein